MGSWFLPACLALMNFGLWGIFTKLSVNHIDAKNAFFYQTIGVLITGILIFYFMHFKASTNIKGVTFGVLTGLAYGAGCLFYFVAAARGNIVNVITLTSLYPLVTIVFSYLFLHEEISLRQALGIVFAVVAMVLFAG